MIRTATFLIIAGVIGLSAYLPQQRPQYAINSLVERFFRADARPVPALLTDLQAELSDTTPTHYRILLLNHSVYDSAYAVQMRLMLQRELPQATIAEFWEGNAEQLDRCLRNADAVIVPYIGKGDAWTLGQYGKKLDFFAQKGGMVLFSGTHDREKLDQYGLLHSDYSYFFEGATVHLRTEHELLKDIPTEFNLVNFAYPLDLKDPAYEVLADVDGLPVLCHKTVGNGEIIYFGLEYFTDEKIPAQLLSNAFRWAANLQPAPKSGLGATTISNRALRNGEERLYAGSTAPKIEVKVYPNPYVDKATVEFSLNKPTQVSVELADESGRLVAVLLPSRQLSTVGTTYQLDLPAFLAPGNYFVTLQYGSKQEVRKVIKTAK
jgi:Secretion system C-terminal sorting domain